MQRYLSLISTPEQSTGMQRACDLWQHLPRVLWITHAELTVHSTSLCIPANKARTVLGREFDLVVFDAWSGLDVNALAAVSGTICAGGTLVLLTPPLSEWPQYPDPDCQRFLPYPWRLEQVVGHFVRRFVSMLEEVREEEDQESGNDLLIVPERLFIEESDVQFVQTTTDQKQALAKILSAEQPVVLSADRGRGKSAVLGMAAQQLHATGKQVVLTAPAKATVSSVLQHAQYPVEFYAPDDLLQSLPAADVLLIDEAAAIPLPMLLKMVQHYPYCVFATTLQGYEGSGRGFVLRFQRELTTLHPDWLEVKMRQPIRWQEGDQLEAFINRWLLLDGVVQSHSPPTPLSLGAPFLSKRPWARGGKCLSSLAPRPLRERGEGVWLLRHFLMGRGSLSPIHTFDKSELKYQKVSQVDLLSNEAQLKEIFNLLVNAHYQTRPSDLRQILDAPHITLHTLQWQQQIVAVALLAKEGGLDEELTKAIHAGERRPHGHLLAQSLTFHAGLAGAACLHCERVMRIAVLPELQREGLGRILLAKLHDYAQQQQADYLGVSYALSPGLLNFWRKADFKSARLGYRKDKASGSRSLMQVCGLSKQGRALAEQAAELFQRNLPDLLLQLGDVPDELAAELKT